MILLRIIIVVSLAVILAILFYVFFLKEYIKIPLENKTKEYSKKTMKTLVSTSPYIEGPNGTLIEKKELNSKKDPDVFFAWLEYQINKDFGPELSVAKNEMLEKISSCYLDDYEDYVRYRTQICIKYNFKLVSAPAVCTTEEADYDDIPDQAETDSYEAPAEPEIPDENYDECPPEEILEEVTDEEYEDPLEERAALIEEITELEQDNSDAIENMEVPDSDENLESIPESNPAPEPDTEEDFGSDDDINNLIAENAKQSSAPIISLQLPIFKSNL